VGTDLWDEILGVIDSIQYEYGGAVLLTLDGDRTTEDLRSDVLLMRNGGVLDDPADPRPQSYSAEKGEDVHG